VVASSRGGRRAAARRAGCSADAREGAPEGAVGLHGRGSVVQIWTMGRRYGRRVKFRPPLGRSAGDRFWSLLVYICYRQPYTQATRDALINTFVIYLCSN
jgi:hypothetical protein